MTAITYDISAALALQEVRAILNEPTAVFWTDEEINNWVIQASQDCATKGLGVITSDTLTLVEAQEEYTSFTSGASVSKCLKVLAAAYDTSYKGLMRISPLSLYHLPNKTSGEPDYYYHLNTVIGVSPSPAAGQAGDLVTVWYSITADDVAELPDYYQHFTIWYALAMAYAKAGRENQSDYWMAMYTNGVNAAKNDIYNPAADSSDKLTIPDRTVVAQR
jgi:hypothetical protein